MSTLRPLELSASLSNWRLYHLRLKDPQFDKVSKNILKRHDHQCAFCGFNAASSLTIVNLDGNYFNHHASNLLPACPFCCQCNFIESVGVSGFGGGTLIYLPEMKQNELNIFCHTLFSSLIQGGMYADVAKSIYRDLKLRSQIVEKHYGKGMSKASKLGQLILDAPIMRQGEYDKKKILKDLRLLPAYSRFLPQLLAWYHEAIEFWNNK